MDARHYYGDLRPGGIVRLCGWVALGSTPSLFAAKLWNSQHLTLEKSHVIGGFELQDIGMVIAIENIPSPAVFIVTSKMQYGWIGIWLLCKA